MYIDIGTGYVYDDAGFINEGREMTMERKIILGSASPRRKELLAQIGVEFEVRVSQKEEVFCKETPSEIVQELALSKAENVLLDLCGEQKGNPPENTVILGADTVVVLDGKILGKPADEREAFSMIQALQGRDHEVYTGVAILEFDGRGERTTVCHAAVTKVYVNEMSEEEIRRYIETREPMDKAGAYGIQGRFAPFIEKIDGDYYNVVGLPVSYVYRQLFPRSGEQRCQEEERE